MLSRRRLATTAAAGLALPLLPRGARAAAWPARPVSIIVPFPAGGTTDLLARAAAEALSARTGQAFTVENRAGRGSAVGTAQVARAAADGQTLLLTTSAIAINAAIVTGLPFDARSDFAAVTVAARNPLLLAVPYGSPHRSVADLVDAARKAPMTFGSSGNGTVTHMALEMFAARAGIGVTHTPYRGSAEAVRDLAAGVIDAAFDNPAPLMPLIRENKVRALGVTTGARDARLPGVPTLAEAGIAGIDISNWFALFAPSATPPALAEAIHGAFAAVLSQPALVSRFAADMVEVKPTPRAEAHALLLSEIEAWGRVARERNITIS